MRKIVGIILLFYILVFQLSFALEEKFKVKVYSQKAEEGVYYIVADNEAPFPQQIEVKFNSIENMQPSVKLPFYCEIEAGKKNKALFTMNTIKKGKYGYNMNYSYFIGSIKINSSENVVKYKFPFKTGEKYMLSQGNYGEFSHTGSSKFAFDFNMKEGSSVCAARDGIVAEIRDGGTVGKDDEKFIREGNHIVIYHSDGTLAMYSHLQNGGIKVKLGEYVKAGDIIGLSGNTGYTNGPHLHFVVLKPIKLGYESIKIEFAGKNRNKIEMSEGEYYGN